MSDFVSVTAEAKPTWWRAITRSGKPAGLGFECPKCRLGYAHDAPQQIYHCGRMESAPKLTAILPTYQLGGGAPLPRNVFLVAWD